jgi:hypothetical protein
MNTSEARSTPSATTLNPTFSGHETFTFRYTWLKKGVDGILSNPSIFQTDDAIVELGVGKNMVASIRHWSLATGVLEDTERQSGERRRTIRVSDFGKKLLSDRGWDPYLEDDASLWLLHWSLVTNRERATTWYFAFNLLREPEFTRTSLFNELVRFAEESKWERLSKSTLESDIACFIRTYVSVKRGVTSTLEDSLDCPLTTLGLLHTDEKGERFRFNGRAKSSLPTAVFGYALADFWNTYKDSQNTLSVREIVHGPGSPGRAFRIDEDTVLGYLDNIADVSGGAFVFEDNALVRQVVRKNEIKPLAILTGYYRTHE